MKRSLDTWLNALYDECEAATWRNRVPEEKAFSREVLRIYWEARDCAQHAGKPLDSTHLILAIFLVQCEARAVFTEKHLTLDRLLAMLPVREEEAPETVPLLFDTAAQIAQNLGSSIATSVHLLLAVSRFPRCKAAILVDKAGLPVSALRTQAMAHLTDPRLRRAAAEKLAAEGVVQVTQAVRRAPRALDGLAPAPIATRAFATSDEEDVIEFMAAEEGEAGEPDKGIRDGLAAAETLTRTWRFALPEEQFPLLNALGHNLTLLAEKGLLDPLIGREDDLEAVIDILCKRRANNPLLLGDPGVGKTALVEGLARFIVTKGDETPALAGKVIVAISIGDLLAGTGVRGSFEARLKGLKEEVLKAERRVILFIDEIHTLIGSGPGEGMADAANELKGALARGEFPCIGATTFGEYRRYIQPDPALDRRFEKVLLREPSLEEADRILAGLAPLYERFHGVTYAPDALHAAVRLSDRFISERSLPAKAIDLIDRAGARARREGRTLVTRQEVVGVLSGLVDAPRNLVAVSPVEGLRGFEKALAERVVGHREAVASVAKVLSQNWARFASRRPLGALLFAGPRGVGKRTLVRCIAEVLFGSTQALLEIDLSDYAEPHAVSHLIGSPPGYVGFEEGGLLADSITRRPFLVISWSNVELAHSAVHGLLAQILSEGTITDRRGRRLDFRNTVHVLILHEETGLATRQVGFGTRQNNESQPTTASAMALSRILPQEILTALDQVVRFYALSSEELMEIARRFIKKAIHELEAEFGVTLLIHAAQMEALAARCSRGARIPAEVESAVAEILTRPALDLLVKADPSPKSKLEVRVTENGEVAFRPV